MIVGGEDAYCRRSVALPLPASRRVLARAETPARKPAMTRPAARSSSTLCSQPTRDGHTLSQTQRIRSRSRLDASSLHGNADHSVRAQAANSRHMPLPWSPSAPGARHVATTLCLVVLPLTTHGCDDPTRANHVRPPRQAARASRQGVPDEPGTAQRASDSSAHVQRQRGCGDTWDLADHRL